MILSMSSNVMSVYYKRVLLQLFFCDLTVSIKNKNGCSSSRFSWF